MPEFIVPGEDDFSVFKETLSPEGDGSHWGLTDLYTDWEKTLRDAFEQDKWFEATWTSKKELWTGRIVRRPEYVVVEATVFCDEDEDLVTDAIWEMCKPNNDLYEEMSSNNGLIRDIVTACEDPYSPSLGDHGYTSSMKLSQTADFEQCLAAIADVLEEADQQCDANFTNLIDLIKWITGTRK